MDFSDPQLKSIYQKVQSGERLGLDDGLVLYRSPDLIGVGNLADFVRKKLHGQTTYYVYNQHLNYTNVCINRCLFCAYSRDEGEEGAFTLTIEEVEQRIRSRLHEPICEVHIVGGLNPALPFSFYLDLLGIVRQMRPEATIKAFTPVEIDFFSRISGLGIREVLAKLKASGLSMMPGGGAEVLSERIHKKLYPKKIGPERWLEVVRTAHETGIATNASMLYGHIETLEERILHLLKLRALQDGTRGIEAFIPLAFHPERTG
ncbi:MAG: radical SAM protein, partial [Thermodesulfobacteriota bacterium]|nr:radical SAM protein [Thermodesulfobacteriota bacterium]